MTEGAVVGFDGAWSHWRRAKECVVILIDCKTKKIVDFEIVTKAKHDCPGNYVGSPNGMELAGLKKIIERWKFDERVVGCVHDNDSKATKAIQDAQWRIDQFFDPNHVVKQFERRWASCPTKHLRNIRSKLLLWFKHLIRSDFTFQQKEFYWMNSLEHFKGNHRDCPREHPVVGKTRALIRTEEAEGELMFFLRETAELVNRTRSPFNTQMNESFNAVKAKFASKQTSWKVSWPIRIMCAILQMNSTVNWRIPLAAICRIELSADIICLLEARYAAQENLNKMRRTPEAQLKECRRRWEAKQKEKREALGAGDYRLSAPCEQQPAEDSDDELLRFEPATYPGDSVDEVRIVRTRPSGRKSDDDVKCKKKPSNPSRPPSKLWARQKAIQELRVTPVPPPLPIEVALPARIPRVIPRDPSEEYQTGPCPLFDISSSEDSDFIDEYEEEDEEEEEWDDSGDENDDDLVDSLPPDVTVTADFFESTMDPHRTFVLHYRAGSA